MSNFDIIDIRHDAVEIKLKDEILNSLRPTNGLKTLPTLLLYNERGLQLYEDVCLPNNYEPRIVIANASQITYLHEYYLVNAEIDVLERSADSIASAILPGSMIIELGSGSVTVSGHPQKLGTNMRQ
jgi:uncharacterized SAM-dependent methyltransferase